MKKKVEVFESRGKAKRIIIFSMIILAVLITGYFNFFHYSKCSDWTCFNNNLVACKKSTFINEKEDSSWSYAIKGTSKGSCLIYVKNIRIALKEAKDIKDKDMLCYLPKGMITAPESDLDLCHGLLKETLQDIIIEQLHVYIVQNIGQIKESITTPL